MPRQPGLLAARELNAHNAYGAIKREGRRVRKVAVLGAILGMVAVFFATALAYEGEDYTEETLRKTGAPADPVEMPVSLDEPIEPVE